MTISTSVVICAYTEKRWDQLIAAVESVQASVPVGQIVLVIDHHDGLLNNAPERWPALTVAGEPGPAGLSAARNTGIEASSGDVVLLPRRRRGGRARLGRICCAPYADPRRPRGRRLGAARLWQHRRQPAWWPEEFGWVVGCSYRGQPTRCRRYGT